MASYKTFLKLWIGQTVSGLGSQLTGFGLAVWVYQQTRSVTAMAMIFMAAAVPGILLSPLIGALVDRLNRKRTLMFADAFAGFFSLMLVGILYWGKLQIWQVYLVAGGGSIANTIMWPTMAATTTLLVPKEHLGRANGLLQFGDAGSIILAPIVGGLIYAFSGLTGLVAVDVASFLFAIGMTVLSKVPQPAKSAEGIAARESLLKEAMFGFRFIFERPGLVALLGYFMFINLVLPISSSLVTPLVLSHWDSKALGLVQSIAGLGMLVGTVIMAAWGGPRKKINGVWILGTVAFGASLLLLLPLSLFTLSASFFLMMISAPIINACSQVIWQRKTPADVQGKVFAVRRMIAWFMTPLAFALAGPLADRVFEPHHQPAAWLHTVLPGLIGYEAGAGLRSMFIFSGALCLLASAAMFLFPRFRHLEEELPEAASRVEESGTEIEGEAALAMA